MTEDEQEIINGTLAIFMGSLNRPRYFNYCGSLVDMDLVEERIDRKNLVKEYVTNLHVIVNKTPFPNRSLSETMTFWNICHAKAMDRAMAAYLTIKEEVFCDNCEHLNLTETAQDMEFEQNGSKHPKPFHQCYKYDKVLDHKSCHPHIPKLIRCSDGDKP